MRQFLDVFSQQCGSLQPLASSQRFFLLWKDQFQLDFGGALAFFVPSELNCSVKLVKAHKLGHGPCEGCHRCPVLCAASFPRPHEAFSCADEISLSLSLSKNCSLTKGSLILFSKKPAPYQKAIRANHPLIT